MKSDKSPEEYYQEYSNIENINPYKQHLMLKDFSIYGYVLAKRTNDEDRLNFWKAKWEYHHNKLFDIPVQDIVEYVSKDPEFDHFKLDDFLNMKNNNIK